MISWKTTILAGLVAAGISCGTAFAQPSDDPSAIPPVRGPATPAPGQVMQPVPYPAPAPQYYYPGPHRGGGYYYDQRGYNHPGPGYAVDYRQNGYGYHHRGGRRGGHCWW